MASTRDLAIVLISAAAGAAAAAAALRFLSACRTSSPGTQNQPLAANGSAAEAKRPSAQSPFNPAKREGYISWDDYFMAIAFLSAQRSKDPNRQVGACLVSQEGIILGIGYNGFPRGCSDNKLPWAKKSENGNPLETKYPYVVHAEVNAILNTNHASVAGQKLYVTMFPCNECAKIIVQVRKHQPQMSEIPIRFLEPQSSTSETNDARLLPAAFTNKPGCCWPRLQRTRVYWVYSRPPGSDAPRVHSALPVMSTRFPPPLRPSSAPPPPAVTRALHAINTCTSAAALAPLRDGILRDLALLRNTTVVSAFFLACGRLRHHGPALALFASIPRPHVFVFNSLLRSLTAPPFSPLPLFGHFLRIGVRRPNRYTFPFMLAHLSSLRDLGVVHSQVIRSGFGRDLHVRNALLARYAACELNLSSAEQLFDEMPRPDVVSWTTMITSYRNRGHSFQALATLRRMLASSVSPNRVTMVSALGACAAHGAVDTGVWIHEYVKKQGWELDVVLGTALVDMYGKCGRVVEAEGVFSEMVERNVYTWNAIIGALALAEDGKTALQWFFRMNADGVQPDEVTLVCVLCACAHAGFVEIGKKIFNLIVQGEYGFQPGIKHFGCMVDLLSRSGHLDDALRVIETMPSQPNAVIWGLLLRGCKARGDSILTEHVTKKLLELEPDNASHYVLLSNLYAETGRWLEAEEVLKWVKSKGLMKDAGWSLKMLEDSSEEYMSNGDLMECALAKKLQECCEHKNIMANERCIKLPKERRSREVTVLRHGSSDSKINVPVDVKKQPWEQMVPLHNRWHPDIPPVADVTEGELFRVEMIDWTGGRVRDDNSADDIKFLDLTITHYLSGPLRIVDSEGIPASPGDVLAIEICNLGPLPGDEWGYTAIFERENGGGFLTDHFPSARKAIWYFEGIYAYSPQIPGKSFCYGWE
ncbi:hypothetical protein PR202_ga09552 [Eleusine coracana subsp. coracana]|uniref:CMP/dCMP-type deaminase domain-containing protein n=1 Tax=Eleusine coracana subsp. coracana TaxID=191504 RepID=A0AAV5C4U8_ELECO|nr:hypothetical protein PR202_ga09552 [Eleusine coracana subsp. coracana]